MGNGLQGLRQTGLKDSWEATNDQLKAGTPGLSYRWSKSPNAKLSPFLTWGKIADGGVDEGNGWVRFTIVGEKPKEKTSGEEEKATGTDAKVAEAAAKDARAADKEESCRQR